MYISSCIKYKGRYWQLKYYKSCIKLCLKKFYFSKLKIKNKILLLILYNKTYLQTIFKSILAEKLFSIFTNLKYNKTY